MAKRTAMRGMMSGNSSSIKNEQKMINREKMNLRLN